MRRVAGCGAGHQSVVRLALCSRVRACGRVMLRLHRVLASKRVGWSHRRVSGDEAERSSWS